MSDGMNRVKALLSILGTQSNHVLEHLPSDTAAELRKILDENTAVDPDLLNQYLKDAISSLKDIIPQNTSDDSLSSELSLDELQEEPLPLDTLDEKPEPIIETLEEKNTETKAPIEEPTISVPDFDYQDIKATLLEQSPQTVALLLSRVDETVREEIIDVLPSSFTKEVNQLSVDENLLTNLAYETLYHSLFSQKVEML